MSRREPTDPESRRAERGSSPNRRALLISVVVVVGLLAVAAFVGGPGPAPGSPTFPPVGSTTRPAGAAALATRADVAAALGAVGLQVEDAAAAYRPAESARFASAPRLVLRAILPDDPDHGRIVIYEFLSPAEATSAADEQAAYVGSGVGRVQFLPDTRITLRVVGSTAIFFAWSPDSSPDPRTSTIGTALATLGLAVTIPN